LQHALQLICYGGMSPRVRAGSDVAALGLADAELFREEVAGYSDFERHLADLDGGNLDLATFAVVSPGAASPVEPLGRVALTARA
jgi:hypothetical protein